MSSLTKLLSVLAVVSGATLSAIPAWAQEDPPAEVARIAGTTGTVSFHGPGAQDWQAASANYPLTAGSGVWAEPRSHAAVDIAGARVNLDGASALEITAIDPGQVRLSVPQGAVFVHVYPGATGQSFEIDTAHGAAYINQPGQYEIVAGDDQHPSSLSVFEGAAQLVGQGANLGLRAGQRGSIAPDNGSNVDAAVPDDLVRMVQAEEQPYQAQVAQTAQYVSPQTTGYQDLARYGQWGQAPQYGAVWYPTQVAAGWAPYRYGHWAFVAPWGWTWVDDAPWGFTPFHYGRWVEIHGRWAWLPGVRVARPVYAPALVTFFGDLGGIGINLSVGWVPLGPEEVYRPPYHHSQRYGHDVNYTSVRNETKIVNVVNNTTIINYNNYTNRRGATFVNRDVMANSRAVAPAYGKQPHGQDDKQWQRAKPMSEVPFRPEGNGAAPRAATPKFNGQQKNKPYGQPNGGQSYQPQNKNDQKSKNAAPAPYIAPQDNGGTSAKPNGGAPEPYQPKNKDAQKPKSAAPAPYIAPQGNGGTEPNGQAPKLNGQNGQPQQGQQQKSGQPKYDQQKNGQQPNGLYPKANGNPPVPQPPKQQQKNQQQKNQQEKQPAFQPPQGEPQNGAAPGVYPQQGGSTKTKPNQACQQGTAGCPPQ